MAARAGGTKARIREAALELFNARGSSNVTTNLVAETLGMSPGNLYYHYRSKEDIVRALFADLDAEWDAAYRVDPGARYGISDVVRQLHVTFEVMWRHRFFYRETLVLLHNDPELAARYREVRARGLADTEGLLALLEHANQIRLPRGDAAARPELARLVRIVTDHWLTFKALGAEPIDPTDLHEGVELVLRLLRPHLTPAALDALARYERARLDQDVYHARLLDDLASGPQGPEGA